ncbi:GNAT family N-acetyltransferase [Paenibacillus sp. L3-i20]|uniref:GNAT family N-acetyltransferase n=1 Tax=Paenibacillus sp. L3-i20 TaxID=2905833 RepID=UPI001EDC9E42|nr:GNAT family N-acetyltransferase [Paenibacillus sp. L3-i20]GKU78424.1 hypothetical protein L3i20_v228210 [Paenibacillus sp. L3-i20]
MKLSINIATEADIRLLGRMNKELIDDEGSSNPMNVIKLEQRMRGFLATDYRADILMIENEPIGYALYRFSVSSANPQKQDVYLRQYFIERIFRGRGYGMQGIELLKNLRFASVDTLSIDVLAANTTGHQFWVRAGFQPYSIQMNTKLNQFHE